MENKKWYMTRKLWVAIISTIIIAVNLKYGLDIEPEQIMAVISPLLVWIGVQGTQDIKNGK